MAHELGHFSQKAGSRAHDLIRAINFWLVRLAFHRDRFDRFLERLIRHRRNPALEIYLKTLALPVTLTHKILRLLMLTGRTLSAHLSRQMEYDADRYEVRLAGYSSFDSTLREYLCLHAAQGLAISALQEQWKEKRLVDNFPRLVVATRRQAARAIEIQVERQIANEPAQRFATHPTVRQRIAHALREKGVGVFASDLPATALFSDLAGLEQRASLAFYRAQVGTQVEAASLVPTEDLKERQAQRAAERAALDRYFEIRAHSRGCRCRRRGRRSTGPRRSPGCGTPGRRSPPATSARARRPAVSRRPRRGSSPSRPGRCSKPASRSAPASSTSRRGSSRWPSAPPLPPRSGCGRSAPSSPPARRGRSAASCSPSPSSTARRPPRRSGSSPAPRSSALTCRCCSDSARPAWCSTSCASRSSRTGRTVASATLSRRGGPGSRNSSRSCTGRCAARRTRSTTPARRSTSPSSPSR